MTTYRDVSQGVEKVSLTFSIHENDQILFFIMAKINDLPAVDLAGTWMYRIGRHKTVFFKSLLMLDFAIVTV